MCNCAYFVPILLDDNVIFCNVSNMVPIISVEPFFSSSYQYIVRFKTAFDVAL